MQSPNPIHPPETRLLDFLLLSRAPRARRRPARAPASSGILDQSYLVMKAFQYHSDSGVVVVVSGLESAHFVYPSSFPGVWFFWRQPFGNVKLKNVQGALTGHSWHTRQRRLVTPDGQHSNFQNQLSRYKLVRGDDSFLQQEHSRPAMNDNSQTWNEHEHWLFMQQQGGGQAQTSSNGSCSPHSSTSDISSSSHGSYHWAHGSTPFDPSSVSQWVGPRKSLTLFYTAKINPILPKTPLSPIIPPPLGFVMVPRSSTPPLLASTAHTTSAAIQWEALANTA